MHDRTIGFVALGLFWVTFFPFITLLFRFVVDRDIEMQQVLVSLSSIECHCVPLCVIVTVHPIVISG